MSDGGIGLDWLPWLLFCRFFILFLFFVERQTWSLHSAPSLHCRLHHHHGGTYTFPWRGITRTSLPQHPWLWPARFCTCKVLIKRQYLKLNILPTIFWVVLYPANVVKGYKTTAIFESVHSPQNERPSYYWDFPTSSLHKYIYPLLKHTKQRVNILVLKRVKPYIIIFVILSTNKERTSNEWNKNINTLNTLRNTTNSILFSKLEEMGMLKIVLQY